MPQRDAKEPPIPFALEGEKAFGRAEGGPNQFQTLAPLIDYDKKCFTCGYNVRGLRYGQPCPECGKHITRRDPVPDLDAKDVLPVGYFAAVSLVLFVGVGAFATLWLWPISSAAFSVMPTLDLVVRVLAAGAWLMTVLVVSWPPPGAVAGQALGRAPKDIAVSGLSVASQACWLVAALPWAIAGFTLGQHSVFRAIGYFGLFFVSLQVGRTAERIGDTDAAERFVRTGVAFIVFAALGMLFDYARNIGPVLLLAVLSLFSIAANVMVVLTLFNFTWQLYSLGRTARWAISSRRAHEGRDRRLAERFRKERAEARRRLEESQPFGGPLP